MKKAQIAVCIEDPEYRNRLISCLMKHYQNQVELHVFEGTDDVLAERNRNYEVYLLCAGEEALQLLSGNDRLPIVCLQENMEGGKDICGEEIYPVQMYQEVNVIMDEVLSHVHKNESEGSPAGNLRTLMNITAVYSLSDGADQLPFSVTLQSIMAEEQRMLLVDLQENSGFTQLMTERAQMGLEDLLLMVQGNAFSRSRALSCIGHKNGMDFVYPPECPESICEADAEDYRNLFAMLPRELEYQGMILNLGMRFQGFLEIMNLCNCVYLLRKQGYGNSWREEEFMEELRERGYEDLADRVIVMEIPLQMRSATSLERLIEEWKWNEPGDRIRQTMPARSCDG